MFQPDVFTVVFSHPDAEPVVATGVGLRQMWGVVLNARPVRQVFIVPMEMGDEYRDADSVIARTKRCVYAERPTDDAGLVAHFMSDDGEDTPSWARTVIKGVDCTVRAERQRARAARLADARRRYLLHEEAFAERKAHADAAPMYTLEQRARVEGV